MTNSKLIALLETFSSLEWRRFGDFLQSPFFNKNKKLLPIYEYLRSIAPDFPKNKLDKAVLFEKIYPNQTFDKGIFEDITYILLKNAEKFLTMLSLETEQHTENILILEELMKRKLEKHYRTYIKKANDFLNKSKHTSGKSLLYQYQLSDVAKRHFFAQKIRKYDPHLQTSLDHLDEFYFFNKLKSSCEMMEWKNIITADFKFSFTDEVVEYLSSTKEKLSPITSIYLSAYYLLTQEKGEPYFIQLKNYLNDYQFIISDTEKNYLYLFAINYCGIQMRQNNNVNYYVAECLKLYLEGVEQKFLYINGYLSPWTFKNIVKLGFNLKKFDWTAIFIKNYYTHLEKSFQDDAYHYNMADLNYRKQNYGEAQFHLMQVEYSDLFYNLGAKSMLIKIYVETEEEEALLSLIASFTIHLKRNKKIANNIRQIYLNFTTLIYQLMKAKASKIPIIQEKIKATEPLTDRRWLLRTSELLQKQKR